MSMYIQTKVIRDGYFIMGSIAVIGIIVVNITIPFLDVGEKITFISECGYNGKYEFYFHPFQLFAEYASLPGQYYSIIIWIFAVWDLFTLFLYTMKIWTFKKYATEEPTVYKRIMSILHKIFILTIFYHVFNLLYGTMSYASKNHTSRWLLRLILNEMVRLSVCVSMYLMMDHNKEQYLKFLRIIYIFKLHWMCCCWRHFVIDEINSLNKDIKHLSNSTIGIDKNNDNDHNNHQSQWETCTCNTSIDVKKVEMPELSIATKTEQ